MFVTIADYEAQRRRLEGAVRPLRDAPNNIVDILRSAQQEFGDLHRVKAELRAEAWQQRLTRLVEAWQQRLTELQTQVDRAYADAERLVNRLANQYPLPADASEQAVFLTRYAIASNRLTALVGYADDSSTADGIRRLRETGALERDDTMALAVWLDVGQVTDTRGWSITTAVLLELEPLLPEPTRSMIALGRELADGIRRVRSGFAQAFAFVRNAGQTVAVIPAWSEADGVFRVDATTVQQAQSAVL